MSQPVLIRSNDSLLAQTESFFYFTLSSKLVGDPFFIQAAFYLELRGLVVSLKAGNFLFEIMLLLLQLECKCSSIESYLKKLCSSPLWRAFPSLILES